jgi:hypothetical protein
LRSTTFDNGATIAGLLGIALANEEYADEAVQTQLIPAACRYFQRAVMAHRQLSPAQRASLAQQQQQQQHGASWNRHKTPAKPALKAAGAAAAGTGQQLQSQDQGMLDSGAGSQEQQQQGRVDQPSQQQQGQQQLLQQELPGNGYLSLIAGSPDGLMPAQEVLQLRVRKLLSVMRVLTCTGA